MTACTPEPMIAAGVSPSRNGTSVSIAPAVSAGRESIVEPSKTVSDQYQNEQVTTAADQVIVGRVVDETPDKLVMQSNPLAPDRVEVKRADVVERKPAKLSPMPDHLVDVLTADEVLDLIAFLEAAGNKDYKAFKK